MRFTVLLAFAIAVLANGTPALAQSAGILVNSSPMSDVPAGMDAWRISYTSSNDRGQLEEVTGVVIAPEGIPSRLGRPVLAWAHGTWGVADKCTPSTSSIFLKQRPA